MLWAPESRDPDWSEFQVIGIPGTDSIDIYKGARRDREHIRYGSTGRFLNPNPHTFLDFLHLI